MDAVHQIDSTYVLKQIATLDEAMWLAELDRIQDQIFSQSSTEDYVVYPSGIDVHGSGAEQSLTVIWRVATPNWSRNRQARGRAGGLIVDCYYHIVEDVARDMAVALNEARRKRVLQNQVA